MARQRLTWEERTANVLRQMVPGTLGGRIRSAAPVAAPIGALTAKRTGEGAGWDPATYVIAAADSSDHGRQHCWRACDGTADEVEINDALTRAATAPNGGMVLLLEGKYNIGARISVPSLCVLKGMGVSMGEEPDDCPTYIEAQAGFTRGLGNVAAIVVDNGGVVCDLGVKGIDGITGTGVRAVYLGATATLERVVFANGEERTIVLAGNTTSPSVTPNVAVEGGGGDVTVRHCRGNGGAVYISGGNARVSDLYLRQSDAWILLSGGGSQAADCYIVGDFYHSGGDAAISNVNAANAYLITEGPVSGCKFSGTTTLDSNVTLTGCYMEDLTILADCFRAKVMANAIRDDVSVTGNECFISGNEIRGDLTFNAGGDDNRYGGNWVLGTITDSGAGNQESYTGGATIGDNFNP